MQALQAFFSSRKNVAALIGTLVLTLTLLTTVFRKDVSSETKVSLTQTYLYSVTGLWGINIAGIAHEDAAAKKASPSTTNIGEARSVSVAPPASPSEPLPKGPP